MTTLIICIALFCIGIACSFSGMRMKQSKKIPKWMLKGVEVKSTSNIDGFVGSMWYKNLFLGIVIITYSAYRLASTYLPDFESIGSGNIMTGAFLIVLLAYMMMLTNAKREFFGFTQ